jgi:cytochrome c biogenesis protein CcmG/thiol:disulfide interchange protein DsbE
MHRLLALVPILLFAAVSLGLGLSLSNDPRKLPSMLIDKAMPTFTLASLGDDGRGFTNKDLTGKVALLNVFASWCPVCRVEHPTLMSLANNGTVPIYGLNWKDRPGNGARWLKANKSPYVRIGDDPSGRLGIDLGVTGVPETFVVDRTGRIRYRHAGPITDDVWRETFEPLIAELGADR